MTLDELDEMLAAAAGPRPLHRAVVSTDDLSALLEVARAARVRVIGGHALSCPAIGWRGRDEGCDCGHSALVAALAKLAP